MESARDMIGIERDFVSLLVKSKGLWDILPKIPVTTWDDSFCYVVRSTESIPFDTTFREFRKGNHDRLHEMSVAVGIQLTPDATYLTAMNIAAAYHMYSASLRLARALCGMLWNGNPANNTESGSYREFKGFWILGDYQIDAQLCDVNEILRDAVDKLQADDLGFAIVVNPLMLYGLQIGNPISANETRIGDHSVQLIFDTLITQFDYPETPRSKVGKFLPAIYVIPASKNDEDPITYLEYTDYSKAAIFPFIETDDIFFWTDKGLYAWCMETERWDVKLSVKNESRLIIKRPDLITRINVKYKLPLANNAR